jgi:hypothetical protein
MLPWRELYSKVIVKDRHIFLVLILQTLQKDLESILRLERVVDYSSGRALS